MTTEKLHEFGVRLASADPEDETIFAGIVKDGLELLSISNRELADAFEAAVGTIDRWKKGMSHPRAAMRPLVYRWFSLMLARRLR